MKGSTYIMYILIFTFVFSVDLTAERERTFSVAQEEVLASEPKVLSFLFHMTRNKLNFEEMAERYHLNSVKSYYNFLSTNNLIETYEDGTFKFLFLDPYGVWALRTHDTTCPLIYHCLRQKGLDRLVRIIEDKPVNLDDGASAKWTTNTTRLTPEQYREYQQEISRIGTKYVALGAQNLSSNNANSKVVWMMHLAGMIDSEIANTSHLLFGAVEEFD